jgi:23S rRNA (adenine2503-C2)-methyltransferase
MNLEKLSEVLATEPKYRYQQINKFVFQDYISSWQEASSLPKTLREKLETECPLEIKVNLVKSEEKNTEKALIILEDNETVETVLIKQKAGKQADSDARYTICISTQVGCPLSCTFCASGSEGLKRNLSSFEIVEQVIFWGRHLQNRGHIDNVVFMGMGEPFLNYEEFIKAAKFLNNPETLNIGARRLSVSTAGIAPGIKRLSGEKMQINLAISLHAANDNLRRKLMPLAAKYEIEDLIKAVDNYIAKTGRRVMFEYLMLKGVNDSDEDARNLAKLLRRPLYFLNLIPYNDTGRYQASSPETIRRFRDMMEREGVPTTVRMSLGGSIDAACGQLRQNQKK